jgi:hypothetical protein
VTPIVAVSPAKMVRGWNVVRNPPGTSLIDVMRTGVSWFGLRTRMFRAESSPTTVVGKASVGVSNVIAGVSTFAASLSTTSCSCLPATKRTWIVPACAPGAAGVNTTRSVRFWPSGTSAGSTPAGTANGPPAPPTSSAVASASKGFGITTSSWVGASARTVPNAACCSIAGSGPPPPPPPLHAANRNASGNHLIPETLPQERS